MIFTDDNGIRIAKGIFDLKADPALEYLEHSK